MWQWAKIQAVLPSSGRGEGEGRGVGAATAGARTGGGTVYCRGAAGVGQGVRSVAGAVGTWERQGLETEFKALLDQHPSITHHQLRYGRVYGSGSERPGGRDPFFEKAVRIFPPLAEAHFNLGGSYVKAVRLAEAVAAYRNAIRYSDGADGIEGMAKERLRELEKIVQDVFVLDLGSLYREPEIV